MKLHPHAAGLFVLGDPAWRRTLWRAGWTIITPFVGWYIVLGYRLRLSMRFMQGPDVMPAWEGQTLRLLLGGLKATGVILAYLSPVYALTFGIVLVRGWEVSSVSPWIPAVFLVLPFLLPLALPFAICVLAWQGWLGPFEASLLLLAFALSVFVVPAAFLQVSRTGRYSSAFALVPIASFLQRRFVLYARAWIEAAPIAVIGHGLLPIAPWSVFWMYCSVMFLFNEVLVASGECGSDGWIGRAIRDPRFVAGERVGVRTVRAADGEDVRVLDLGMFSGPMPWRARVRSRSGGDAVSPAGASTSDHRAAAER